MAKFTVKLQGFDEMKRKLKSLPKEITREVDAEIEVGAMEIAALAKRAAPADMGILRGEIVPIKEKELQWSVFSQAEYSAFVEFGTRSKVQIPAGLEDEAARLRRDKTQSSLTAKEAIFAWCKRKGIDEKAWYPIFIKLMTVGMTPHPFFFRQLDVVRPKIIAGIKNVLDDKRI